MTIQTLVKWIFITSVKIHLTSVCLKLVNLSKSQSNSRVTSSSNLSSTRQKRSLQPIWKASNLHTIYSRSDSKSVQIWKKIARVDFLKMDCLRKKSESGTLSSSRFLLPSQIDWLLMTCVKFLPALRHGDRFARQISINMLCECQTVKDLTSSRGSHFAC